MASYQWDDLIGSKTIKNNWCLASSAVQPCRPPGRAFVFDKRMWHFELKQNFLMVSGSENEMCDVSSCPATGECGILVPNSTVPSLQFFLRLTSSCTKYPTHRAKENYYYRTATNLYQPTNLFLLVEWWTFVVVAIMHPNGSKSRASTCCVQI